MFAAKIQNSFGTYKFQPKKISRFRRFDYYSYFLRKILSYGKKEQT